MTMQFQRATVQDALDSMRARNPVVWDRLMDIIGDRPGIGECWPIRKNISGGGYGVMWISGVRYRTHRAMFGLFRPEEEAVAPEVRHLCHNPGCINPNHLRGGTHRENMQDRKIAGRGGYLKGEFNGRAKLSPDDVRFIRAAKSKNADLARLYGVSRSLIGNIKSRKLWPHLED